MSCHTQPDAMMQRSNVDKYVGRLLPVENLPLVHVLQGKHHLDEPVQNGLLWKLCWPAPFKDPLQVACTHQTFILQLCSSKLTSMADAATLKSWACHFSKTISFSTLVHFRGMKKLHPQSNTP